MSERWYKYSQEREIQQEGEVLHTTASEDVQGMQEGAPRYQPDFMELAVLWATA